MSVTISHRGDMIEVDGGLPAVGAKAPEFSLVANDLSEITLASYAGKHLIHLLFYNYAAFSYDNKYFAYVGKPSSGGLIHLFELDYVESSNKLLVTDSYLSRYPSFASWVCGSTQSGAVALPP